MPSLFDLPFEDDQPPEPEPAPGAAAPSAPAPEAAGADRLHRQRADRGRFARRSRRSSSRSGSRARSRTARPGTPGHLYFTLKDDAAQIKGGDVPLRRCAACFKPDDGQHVIARGRVSVYEREGEYQIVCEHLEPRGLGALQLAFEQLKRRLAAEGLFDAARKRPLPLLPRNIGIVTSLDGAAVRDILRVLAPPLRRHAHS